MNNKEYEQRELREFWSKLESMEKDQERKEGYKDLLDCLQDEKGKEYLIEKVFGWMINGSFGYGAMRAFELIEAKPRTKVIMGFIWACKLNFMTSDYYVRKAIKASGIDLEEFNNRLIKKMDEYYEGRGNESARGD